MLYKKDLDTMSDGQIFETKLLVKGYDVSVAKTGTKYIDGLVEMKGSVQFKVWSGSTFDEMVEYDYTDTVCLVKGKVNEFNGVKSIIISDIKALQEGLYNKEDFFEDKYLIEEFWQALNKVLSSTCSKEAVSIFNILLGDVQDRFKLEFAARGYHDAVKGGLLAHTYKVTSLMAKVLKFYPAITKNVDVDLLMLGTAIHDIGKVKEYTNGVIKDEGLLVSHHTLGVEILASYKDKILELKDKEFYYRLLAVIEQHHGEYEETPRTIEAYLVHLVDNVESRFQIVNEQFEKGLSKVNIDNFKLN